MPWEITDVMDQRKRFVLKALDPSSCIAELCREFGIARKTGYKWVKRFQEGGHRGLEDLSRRPRGSPSKTTAEVFSSRFSSCASGIRRGGLKSSESC